MTGVTEIKQAIMELPETEYAELRRWFIDQDWEQWEREFKEDVKAGRLDSVAEEAMAAKEQGTFRYL